MASLIELLSKWPLVRQIRERKDGTGLESMSEKTRAMHARIDDAEVSALDLSVLRRGVRPIDFPQGRQTGFNRRRPGIADQPGESLPERRRVISIADAFAARNENEISRTALERVDGDVRSSARWTWLPIAFGNRANARLCTSKTAFLSITPLRYVISAARHWITKKIISSKSFSPEAWAWSVCPTRPGYDIAARCPVWAPPSAVAELQPRNKTWRIQIAF